MKESWKGLRFQIRELNPKVGLSEMKQVHTWGSSLSLSQVEAATNSKVIQVEEREGRRGICA